MTNFYATPELAAHYDEDTAGRTDLDFYVALVDSLPVERVIDIGCGTGLLCSRLVASGRTVLGLDPQSTMLDLARAQPNASAVEWVQGTADDLPSDWADLILMTGHVAQYFPDDEAWQHVLAEAHRALRPDGLLAFEVRNDARQEWRKWSTPEPTATAAGMRQTEVSRDGDRITHVSQWVQGNRRWTTTETLRFPSWAALTSGLTAAGFRIEKTWGDFEGRAIGPESPEWIILARRR
jgi:SAM-dependent methyltransferase